METEQAVKHLVGFCRLKHYEHGRGTALRDVATAVL